jgi:large subunit ribosomal protein L7e
LLKKRKLNAETRAKRARALVLSKRKQQLKKQDIFKRAEKYVREYKRKEQDLVRLRRIARKTKNFYVPAQPSLAFVVRIRGYIIKEKTEIKKI